jgi:thioredoxin reductase (NADPH)
MSEEHIIHDLVIIGGGPAGYTAALYAARANLKPVVIEGFNWGGQLMSTTEVENFPGYPEGIMGPDLVADLRAQAERFGVTFITDDVTAVDFSEPPFQITVDSEILEAKAVIISTGAKARTLGLDSELRFSGRGVSYCATCDGAFFRDKKIVVVGGGDTAFEEALFLTRFGDEVTIVHRRGEFRASKVMQDRASNNPKIKFLTPYVVEEVIGDEALTSVAQVRLKNLETGHDQHFLDCDGVFVAIGHDPNTSLFTDLLDHDDQGYLVTKGKSTLTNIPGIFACGDVQDSTYRQAITAAGSGCAAALDAERFLAEHHS